MESYKEFIDEDFTILGVENESKSVKIKPIKIYSRFLKMNEQKNMVYTEESVRIPSPGCYKNMIEKRPSVKLFSSI